MVRRRCKRKRNNFFNYSINNKKLQILIEVLKKGNNNEKSNLEFSPDAIGIELYSTVVSVSSKYFRPTEVDLLIGNPAKAKEKLGWEAKTDLNVLVKIMLESDLKKVFYKI